MKSSRTLCSSALAAALVSLLVAGCSAAVPIDTSRPGVATEPSEAKPTKPHDPTTPAQPDDTTPTTPGRQTVPAASAERVELSTTVCGGVSASCDSASLRIVNLAAGTFEVHRCVERQPADAGADSGGAVGSASSRFGSMRGDVVTVSDLSSTQVKMVRDALAAVRYQKAKKTYEDGPMTALVVAGPQGELALSPSEACGADDYNQIVDGLDGLAAAIDQL